MEPYVYSPAYVLVISVLISFALTIFHYEVLGWLTTVIAKIKNVRKIHVLIAMLALTATHMISIGIYAIIYYVMINILEVGGILNTVHTHFDTTSFRDLIYYSITVYTSLGFGDLVPTGGLRVISGLETLNGLILVAWTASYSYLVMSKYWTFKNTSRKLHFK
tara:strand:- start:823 stop:1311 length:489 start_codon:yes stop_codon:yes gene_type:complete